MTVLALMSHALARDDWCSAAHDDHEDEDHAHEDEHDHAHEDEHDHAHDDDDDDHASDDDSSEEIDAHPEDFLVELFHLYGTNDTCVITEEGTPVDCRFTC